MEDNENIFFMIQQCYSSLSKTQRRIADYLLQHPNTGCFLTLKQLSKETHTTEATILSFSRSIGCDSLTCVPSCKATSPSGCFPAPA